MGTVGINFGAATSGTGFDVTTTVASIVANLKAVETPWTTQLTSLKAQSTAFTSIGTDLATLSNSLQALTDFQGVTATKLGSSSDTNILSLGIAGATAASGSHSVVVSQLAQASFEYSGLVPTTDILTGAFTIQVGSGAATTIPVVSGTSDTLQTYAAAINLAGIGVTASVISDTTGSRLAIVSNNSGLVGQLTVTAGGTTPAASETTPAATTVAPTDTVPATSTFTLPSTASQLSGSFSYAVGGNGGSGTVSLGSAPLSLNAAAGVLNADSGFLNAGLVASVSGSSLIITGATDSSGAAAILTNGSTLTTTTPAATYGALTDTTASTAGVAVTLNTGLKGQDAKLTVDGLGVDSASNTISTAIPGVSFQILSSSPSTTVQVQIANNNSGVETAFSTFVTAYNAVVKDITTQEGTDASGNTEPLFGNTVISQLQSSLSLALTSGLASGSVNSLYQLGISLNQDGTLTLDSTTLDSELNSNYSDVVGYLQNDKSFGLTFQNSLDQLGSQSPTGAITLALAANASQETVYNNDVTAQDALIASDQTKLTAQLNTANETLQAIPEQLNEVNELYSAMTGYNTNSLG
jgi:flagellar hook-associated protein 2